jgi:hypothetical protein
MSTLNVNRIVDASGGVFAPVSSVFKNRIINGACVIDQRNAGASVTPVNAQFTLDRWKSFLTQASKFSIQQNAGSVSSAVGFPNYLGATSLSAYSVTATDYFLLSQLIEGFNTSDLGWGGAGAKTVTLSFQVYSSLTGTFGGALGNSAGTRSYPFSYSVPVANTWTTISVTIAGDTSGTWVGSSNGVGIALYFSLGAGSTYSGTAGAWSGNAYFSATGATSVVGTNGATFYITGVQLEVGTQATSFEYRQYGTELALCQRYYEVGTVRNALIWSGITSAAGTYYTNKGFCTTKRASATVTTSDELVSGFVSATPSLTADSTGIQASRNSNGTPTTSAFYFYNWQASAEL